MAAKPMCHAYTAPRVHPRIANVRQCYLVRFAVQQSVCPFSRACARVGGRIWGGRSWFVWRRLSCATSRAMDRRAPLSAMAAVGGKRLQGVR